jgi:signal peptidase
MKAGRAVVRLLLILVISVTLGLAVYTGNARQVLNNRMPMPFGIGISVVLSGSMEPALSVNDLVIVKRADAYGVNDIVVYQSDSSLTIHRIVSVNEAAGRVTTRGDANDINDPEIPVEAIKGKLAASVPGVGLIVRILKSTPGTIAILVLAAFLMVRSWKQEETQSDEDLEKIRDEIRKLKGETGEGKPDPEAIKEEIRRLRAESAGENTAPGNGEPDSGGSQAAPKNCGEPK